MESDTLEKLYIYELEELYNAERQFLDLFLDLSKAATSPRLKAAFERDAVETEEHVERLEVIFEERGIRPGERRAWAWRASFKMQKNACGKAATPM